MSVKYLLLALSLITSSSAVARDMSVLAPGRRAKKRKASRRAHPATTSRSACSGPTAASRGLDVDLIQAAAKALGVEAEFVKSAWPTLMKDFVEKCDVGVGGISVTLDRQKTRVLLSAYMVNGKAPITKCENVARVPDRSPTSTSRASP